MDAESLRKEGWKTIAGRGFNAAAGPFWYRGRSGEREVGLLVEERHSNDHMGSLHGGALMTFADIALGWVVSDSVARAPCVTAQLQAQFVWSAKIGDFVTCRAEIVRSGSSLVFVRGLIKVGDRTIANADGIWKVLKAKEPKS